MSSAFKTEEEPREGGPLVVFLGRSNVGKSSMINRLLGATGLARTSSTPGRTQSTNFFRVNDTVWFVDLPGYGYARVPAEVRRTWGPRIESFLDRRAREIASAIVLVDARVGATELDLLMADWLDARSIRYLVAATKSDKLSGNARTASARALVESLRRAGKSVDPVLASARTGVGTREIWASLDRALEAFPTNGRKTTAWTSAS